MRLAFPSAAGRDDHLARERLARGRGFEPRLETPKDSVLPLHHPRSQLTLPSRSCPIGPVWPPWAVPSTVGPCHGLPDQEAPQAHEEEEAQEASEKDALAASS